MATREKTLGELHDYLKSLGYKFKSLREKSGIISVNWDGGTPDASIQTHINSFTWTETYESDKEKLTRLEGEITQLKNRG